MPDQIRSPFSSILLAIKAKLLTATGWTTNRVFLRARSRSAATHPIQSGQYIVVRPMAPTPEEGWVAAAGRTNSGLRRIVEVQVRTRLGADSVDRDDNWLTAANGHFVLEEAVLDALQLFWPEDANHNFLTAEPIRVLPFEPEQKEEDDDPTWGRTSFFFECRYQINLNQNVQ